MKFCRFWIWRSQFQSWTKGKYSTKLCFTYFSCSSLRYPWYSFFNFFFFKFQIRYVLNFFKFMHVWKFVDFGFGGADFKVELRERYSTKFFLWSRFDLALLLCVTFCGLIVFARMKTFLGILILLVMNRLVFVSNESYKLLGQCILLGKLNMLIELWLVYWID